MLIKKIPAINAGIKVRSPQKRSARIGCGSLPLGSVDKKLSAINAGGKAKEKSGPGTQIASRPGLVEARGIEPLSENRFSKASPSAVIHLTFP